MQVLILLAALSTCDPGDILETMAAVKQKKVRVSIVGLAADVYICEKIAQVSLPLLLGAQTAEQQRPCLASADVGGCGSYCCLHLIPAAEVRSSQQLACESSIQGSACRTRAARTPWRSARPIWGS